jgi:hypothetical protein
MADSSTAPLDGFDPNNPDTESKLTKKEFTYLEAVSKGQKLLAMMRANDRDAGHMMNPPRFSAESDFLDQEALNRWGYRRTYSTLTLLSTHFLRVALEALDMYGKDMELNGQELSFEHLVDTGHGDMVYPFSKALFASTINREYGILIAEANFGPRDRWEGAGVPILPLLQHWSDVAYLQWTPPYCQPNNTELNYVLRSSIRNHNTVLLVQHIMRDYRHSTNQTASWLPSGPRGLNFDVNTEQAEALLGTPNGSGVAWLLIQHKGPLGHKVAEKITL